MKVQLFQHHLLKSLSFFHKLLLHLCQNSAGHNLSRSLSRFHILCLWSMCLSLCQYHTVLITVYLKHFLKCGLGHASVLLGSLGSALCHTYSDILTCHSDSEPHKTSFHPDSQVVFTFRLLPTCTTSLLLFSEHISETLHWYAFAPDLHKIGSWSSAQLKYHLP